jgi:hypothetical protein
MEYNEIPIPKAVVEWADDFVRLIPTNRINPREIIYHIYRMGCVDGQTATLQELLELNKGADDES